MARRALTESRRAALLIAAKGGWAERASLGGPQAGLSRWRESPRAMTDGRRHGCRRGIRCAESEAEGRGGKASLRAERPLSPPSSSRRCNAGYMATATSPWDGGCSCSHVAGRCGDMSPACSRCVAVSPDVAIGFGCRSMINLVLTKRSLQVASLDVAVGRGQRPLTERRERAGQQAYKGSPGKRGSRPDTWQKPCTGRSVRGPWRQPPSPCPRQSASASRCGNRR